AAWSSFSPSVIFSANAGMGSSFGRALIAGGSCPSRMIRTIVVASRACTVGEPVSVGNRRGTPVPVIIVAGLAVLAELRAARLHGRRRRLVERLRLHHRRQSLQIRRNGSEIVIVHPARGGRDDPHHRTHGPDAQI